MRNRTRYEPPFSLFAFQDIITSVTGILILLTLIMSLALIVRQLDTPALQSRAVADRAKTTLTQTRVEITALTRRLEKGNREISELANLSPIAIHNTLRNLEDQRDSLDAQRESLRQSVAKAARRQTEWTGKETGIEAARRRLAHLDAELERLRARQHELESQNRLIYNPREHSGKNTWLVDLDGQRLLVAQVGVRRPPRSFTTVAAFRRWAETRNPTSEYFVLLVRPDGIDFYDKARDVLQKAHFDLGVDLIAQDQTVIDPRSGVGGIK